VIREWLVYDEGIKLKPYRDTQNLLTLGIGRCLDTKGISEAEAFMLCDNDITDAIDDLYRLSYFTALCQARQDALVNLKFNTGNAFWTFKKMLAAGKKRGFKTMAAECLDSKAARELPNRYRRIAATLESGMYPAELRANR
jgi:lysozyme